MKAVIYHDLVDKSLHGYSIAEVPDNEQVKVLMQEPIWQLDGAEKVYTTHLTDGEILAVAITNYEPSIVQRKAIVEGAVEFFNQVKSN